MTYEALIKDLKSGKHKPIYFLHGDEPYYIDLISSYIEKNLLEDSAKAFNQIVFYGKDVDYKAITEEARQFPMMSDKRLIIIREAQDMKSLFELADYIQKPVPHTVVVIAYKYKKLDKRTKFAKLILEHAVVFESKVLYDNKMPAWIIEYSHEIGLKLDHKVAQLIAEFLGTDLKKVSNELDKLKISLGSGVKVEIDHVHEQIGISKEFNIFELQKLLGEKDVLKSNMIINYFIDNPKENPIQVTTASLFNYFFKILITAQNVNESDLNLQKLIGLATPTFVKEYKNAARNYSDNHLRNILHKLSEVDLMSKGLGTRSSDDGALLKELGYFILHQDKLSSN